MADGFTTDLPTTIFKAAMHSHSWLLRPDRASRRLRLFCFCYAGGNANIFLDWQSQLNPAIEVCAIQLPGRGHRFGEKARTDLAGLVADIAKVIQKESDLPFAFFGHSLGGLIAFELARYLNDFQMKMPVHLLVSGCDAPQYRQPSTQMHLLSDSALIEKLRQYNGTPEDIFNNPDIMQLMLPTIRADFQLAENFVYIQKRLLKIPISVLAGSGDDHILLDQVASWNKETVGKFDLKWFDGDHFFINSHKNAVLQYLDTTLAPRHSTGSTES